MTEPSMPGNQSAAGTPNAASTNPSVCKDLGVTVSFSSGSYALDTNGKGALDGVSKWMHTKNDRTLSLKGFADPTGNATANLTLSEERADAVKSYLVQEGVDPSRVSTIGHGEEHPEDVSLPADGRTVTFMGCTPAVAAAEVPPEPVVPVEEPPPAPVAAAPVPYEPEATPAYYGSKYGLGFVVGGGFQDFTRTNARALTNGGGSWDARLIMGTRSFIGAEVAYVGSASSVSALGSTSSTLISNGVEGDLRLNIPIVMGAALLEPFAFGGIGWSQYHVSNNQSALSDFSTRSDDVMTVPVGGGIAYTYKAFMIDARGGWTGTYYNNLLLTTNTSNGSNRLDHWGVGGHLGFAF